MSTSTRRSPLRPVGRPREPGPRGGPERLRWLIRRIADDDRDAFVELFARCSGLVSRRLRRQVLDRYRVSVVLAGTFVEVWWLARCHVDPDTNVMAWIDEIVQRRVADSQPAAPSAADPASPGPDLLGAVWRQRVELELAGLLSRRHSPPAGRPREHVPDLQRLPATLDALADCESVTLFLARAYAVVPDFGLTDANRRAVAGICRRLDGLPLAIELAAARLHALTPQQILDQLADRLAALDPPHPGMPDRHRTLRACIDWSFDLCTEAEQRLWARLSVFAGGFELDAVEGICADQALPTADVLPLMSGLIDKSILAGEQQGGRVRYRMLDIIRDYGLEKLRQTGDEARLRRRHRDWYHQWAARAQQDLNSSRRPYWLGRLAREQPNRRTAMGSNMSTVSFERLSRIFVEVADTLVDDFDLLDFLHMLTVRTADLVDASAVGLLLADQRGQLQFMAASHERARILEILQVQASEGPCYDAFRTGQPVLNTDLQTAGQRWPDFTRHALTAGFRSVHAFPMRVRREIIGALNVFGSTAGGTFDEADVQIVQALTDVAAIGLLQERAIRRGEVLTGQLQAALNNRIVIEQAKGAIAQAHGLSGDEAFTALRGYARRTNRKLTEVAQDMLADPDSLAALTEH